MAADVSYLESLRENTTAFAAAARKAGLDGSIPSCPDWTVADLARHTGRVFTSCAAVVRARAKVDFKTLPPMPKDETVVDEFERRANALIESLEALPVDEPVWNWWGLDPIAGFYHRRMAQELAVHRYDAELAAGAPTPIDTALAVDGVDEILNMFVQFDRETGDLGGSLHVHATDADCEWVITTEDGRLKPRPGHEKADAAVRGTASDLLLYLWNRKPADELDVVGEAAVAANWATAVKI